MENILDIIETHLAATGEAPTAFGIAVMNDPRFVSDLRNGRDVRQKTIRKVVAYIEAKNCPAQGGSQ